MAHCCVFWVSGKDPLAVIDASVTKKTFRNPRPESLCQPMFCNPVAFTKSAEITNTTKQFRRPQTSGLIAGLAEITETTDITKTRKNPGCKQQGLEKPDYWGSFKKLCP